METTFQTISPITGEVFVERTYASQGEIAQVLVEARKAQKKWKEVPISERGNLCRRFVAYMEANQEAIAEELTWQMGRPIAHAPGEIRGLAERARYMIEIAEESLATIELPLKQGFKRYITREPLGIVLILAPWNYPYLTAVNSVVPAIMAGNAVILKHSTQTPLCAERFAKAFDDAGLPEGVFQYLHVDHATTARLVKSPEIDFVAFTGSVEGGRAVQQAAADRFIGLGLELGGKDPAYVRADASFDHTVENVVDGVFYNAGQSCCAIERVYVHTDVFGQFVDAFVEAALGYRLGNPLNLETTLGPLVRTDAAQHVRGQVAQAIAAGAQPLVKPSHFAANAEGTPYLAPQVLIDVDHSMEIMTEETFGPAVGIMRVASDDEAARLMNDSKYGLTASIWTEDVDVAIQIGKKVETGTWYMNRCDYLDPALAWTGIKDSGRGCTLSRVGYEQLTRPKSFHLRTSFS